MLHFIGVFIEAIILSMNFSVLIKVTTLRINFSVLVEVTILWYSM